MRRKKIAVLMASIEREYQQNFASGLAEASAGYGIDICIFNSMGYMDVTLSTSETEESMIYDLPELKAFTGLYPCRPQWAAKRLSGNYSKSFHP